MNESGIGDALKIFVNEIIEYEETITKTRVENISPKTPSS